MPDKIIAVAKTSSRDSSLRITLAKDETIVNLVQEIEPDPKISFHRITFNDKRILVVEVEEGTDKPYNLRDQGIFIRRGKTNSRASRLEIEKFFEQKPNN